MLEEALSEKIAVRHGDRIRKVSSFDALIRTLLAKALKGDPRAVTGLVALMRAAGVLTENAEGEVLPEMTGEDTKLLADFLARNTPMQPSDPLSEGSSCSGPTPPKTERGRE